MMNSPELPASSAAVPANSSARCYLASGALLALACVPSAGAVTLKVLNPSSAYAYGGVGHSSWSGFTSDLQTTFSSIQQGSLGSSSALDGADAYFVNLPASNYYYTTAERNNLKAMLQSGKPTIVMFESWGWRTSNAQLATIVGGTYEGEEFNSVLTEYDHPLTEGLSFWSVYFDLGGRITGGTGVYGDTVTTWGSNGNFVLIGDVDLFSNDTLRFYGNQYFADNLVQFLGTPVPEPGTVALGAAALVLLLRRRR